MRYEVEVCDVCAACTVSNVNTDSALVVMLNSPTIIVKLMIILFPSSWWCGAACGRWIIPRGTPGTVGCDLIQAFPTTHAPLFLSASACAPNLLSRRSRRRPRDLTCRRGLGALPPTPPREFAVPGPRGGAYSAQEGE